MAPKKREIESLLRGGSIIARGSSRHDYHGGIDVFRTKRDISSWSQLERAVRDIVLSGQTDQVRAHIEDWKFAYIPQEWKLEYTPEVHVLIQQQVTDLVGSALRHPHTGMLMIEYNSFAERYDSRELGYGRKAVSLANFEEGRGLWHLSLDDVLDSEIHTVIETIEILERSGLLDEEYAYQFEFGLRPVSLFQARPFKKKSACRKHAVPDLEYENKKGIFSRLSFGFAPAEGESIMLRTMDTWGFERNHGFPENPYGIHITDKFRSAPRIDAGLGNLRVYLSDALELQFQSHWNYRLMKRAEFSGVGCSEYGVVDRSEGAEQSVCSGKLYANGQSMAFMPSVSTGRA
ncbi:MAG: hypothetical protein ABIH41_04960 [Nanoarchaeota archaeon]